MVDEVEKQHCKQWNDGMGEEEEDDALRLEAINRVEAQQLNEGHRHNGGGGGASNSGAQVRNMVIEVVMVE